MYIYVFNSLFIINYVNNSVYDDDDDDDDDYNRQKKDTIIKLY